MRSMPPKGGRQWLRSNLCLPHLFRRFMGSTRSGFYWTSCTTHPLFRWFVGLGQPERLSSSLLALLLNPVIKRNPLVCEASGCCSRRCFQRRDRSNLLHQDDPRWPLSPQDRLPAVDHAVDEDAGGPERLQELSRYYGIRYASL